MGLSRQEYGNGLPFPSPGDLPDPRIEPVSPVWQAVSLPLSNKCLFRFKWRRQYYWTKAWVSVAPCWWPGAKPLESEFSMGLISFPHSSVLAWRIPGTGEPGGLPSMGSHRIRYDWSDLAAAVALTLGFIDINLFIHTTTLRSVCPLSLIFRPWGRLSLREMSYWPDKCDNWDSNPAQSLDLSLSFQI